MKKYFNSIFLPWFILVAGGMGLMLRFWLLADGFDDKGLMISGHPAEWLLWLLTVLTLILLTIGCLPLVQADKYCFNFPPSPAGALGEIVAAAGIIALSIFSFNSQMDIFSMISFLFGLICVPVLVICAWCRLKGKQPIFYLHGIVCVFWMLRLIVQYRVWSPDPQLQDYCFQLLATVFLMLSTYQRTVFDANYGDRRRYAIFHLAALFFCCLSIPGCQDWPLYLGWSVYAATNLCSLISMPGWSIKKANEDE